MERQYRIQLLFIGGIVENVDTDEVDVVITAVVDDVEDTDIKVVDVNGEEVVVLCISLK